MSLLRSACGVAPLLAGICLAAAAAGAGPAGRVEFSADDGPFGAESLVRGVEAQGAQCARVRDAVWVVVEDGAECIRYWKAGFGLGTPRRALYFFSGDLLDGHRILDTSYPVQTPAGVQRAIDAEARRLGVPYVFVARPGTYGSSGDHKQRRRPLESRLLDAAIGAISRRLGTDEIAVAGQSGGGHVVASLLTMRSDIVCAVPSSGVASPRARWTGRGLTRDTTGYADSFEPTEHLRKETMNPALRVFIVGDPNDRNVPLITQEILADRLRPLGVPVEVIEAQGTGPAHHGLQHAGRTVAAYCTKGLPTGQILAASKDLKG